MQRRVKNIAEHMLQFISILPPIDKFENFYILNEAKISLTRLKNALIALSEIDAPALPATLDKLKLFLSARWNCIKKTDAIYLHNPYTPINLACIELAKQLAPIYHVTEYDLLFPPLKFAELKTSYLSFADLPLTGFIFNEDDFPIDILACLDEFRETNKFQQKGIDLNSREKDRVINHSKEAHEYYLSIMLERPPEEIQRARTSLLEAIEGKIKITASYEKDSDKRLNKYICSNISKSSELINLILSLAFRPKWLEFIKDINNDDLFRILLDIKIMNDTLPDRKEILSILSEKIQKLKSKLPDKTLSLFEKERQIKIWLLCVMEIYKRTRENGESYTTRYGFFTSFIPMSTAYTESDKINAANALIEVLLSEIDLKSLKSLKLIGALRMHVGPLSAGLLGYISSEIEKFGEYFAKEQADKNAMLEVKEGYQM